MKNRISLIVLAVIIGVVLCVSMMACDLSSVSVGTYIDNLQEKGYYINFYGQGGEFGSDEESDTVWMILAERLNDEGLREVVRVFKCVSKDAAKKVAETWGKDKIPTDLTVGINDPKNVDPIVEIHGDVVIYGTEQGVKDAK